MLQNCSRGIIATVKKSHLIKCCLASRKSTSHKSVSSYQRFSQRCSISPASGTRDNKTCGFNGIPRISIATSWNFKKMRSLRVFQGFRDFDRKGGRTVDCALMVVIQITSIYNTYIYRGLWGWYHCCCCRCERRGWRGGDCYWGFHFRLLTKLHKGAAFCIGVFD